MMQVVVDKLIDLSEPLLEIWLDFHDEWKNDKNGLPYFILMTSFAGYIVNLYLDKETDLLKRILAAIEDLYRSEGTEVNVLLTSGLFEDIQRFLQEENIPPERFMALLGDKSKERWEAARAYLEEGKSIRYE
jgi:hypothetical protein